MDSSFFKGGTSRQEQKSAIEYMAQAVSPSVNGKVKLTIGDNALAVVALFDAAEIIFAKINALELADYVVTVKTDDGDYAFSRMGSWCQQFYDALYNAYNKAVLRSLFIKDSPILTAKGDYRYIENDVTSSGAAPVQIYENSVAVLPPNLSARRIPLCFVNGMDVADFTLTLKLDTGESYTCAKLGYETAVFADTIEKQIRKLREESLAMVKEFDATLTTAQASQIAKFIPQGAAVSIGQLDKIAPSFVAALENKIAATRAVESYKIFKELCNPAQIWVGCRKNEAVRESPQNLSHTLAGGLGNMRWFLTNGDSPSALNQLIDDNADSGNTDEGQTVISDPYLIWLIAPSLDGQFVAVEFAETGSATFIYRTGGDFDGFAKQLNRALEAINFKREVIRLSDEELLKFENADYYMASKRTAALQFIRSNFVCRVIHSSPEKWKSNLLSYFKEKIENESITQTTSGNICAVCGHINDREMKFCGRCGNSLTAIDFKTCMSCGIKLTAGMRFCGECGAHQGKE